MQTVIALGTFDGMHPGHRAVISRAVQEAQKTGAKSMVYTFSSIPRALFMAAPKMLMSPDERKNEILKMGVQDVVMVDFTREIAEMAPEAFVKMIFDAFGHKAAGNMQMLKNLGKEMGFEVITAETVRVKLPDGSLGEKISSTDIRKALEENKISLAEHLFKGEVL